MEITGRVVVVTGGGNAIGRAMASRFAAEGAAGVVVADIDADEAPAVTTDIGGLLVPTNVADEASVCDRVAAAESAYGKIDLFYTNAGIARPAGPELANDYWLRFWDVNVMATSTPPRPCCPPRLSQARTVAAREAGAAELVDPRPYAVGLGP